MRTCTYCKRLLPDEAFYAYDFKAGRTKCKECKKSYVAERYKQRCRERKCYYCGRSLADSDKRLCAVCKASRREVWLRKFREPQKARSKQRRFEIKSAAFAAYGGAVCRCCGETTMEFLSIDHINNNGAAHRKTLSKSYQCGGGFYRWLRDHGYPPGYQVLCFNCNFAKGHFGYCPHELTSRRPSDDINRADQRGSRQA